MKNNIFGNLSTEGLEQGKDVLGGGFQPLETDVYPGVVKAAYAGAADSGAKNVTVVVELTLPDNSKREYRETIYVTSGTAKGGKHTYTGKDGKEAPLPGFTTVNDLCLLTTGHDLAAQDFEEKVINIYNYDTRGDVPTKVQMAVDLVGQEVKLAIVKLIENKSKKNDATGQYEPTDETRELNQIEKVFHADTNRTVSEVVRKLEAGEFMGQWVEKNKGQARDKRERKDGNVKSGAPGQGASASAPAAGKGKSLFG